MSGRPIEAVTVYVELAGTGPLPGAWVILSLGMSRKNRPSMLAGPANSKGRIDISWSYIEDNVWRLIRASPMDYVAPDSWDGTLRVEAMGRKRVRQVFEAIELWGDLGSLRTEENFVLLRQYLETLDSLGGRMIELTASSIPQSAADIEAIAAET